MNARQQKARNAAVEALRTFLRGDVADPSIESLARSYGLPEQLVQNLIKENVA